MPNPAILGDGRFDFGDAVRSGTRGDQMLDPVLDPFHRPPRDARGNRHEHHVGKHRELDAETAAAVGRNARAKLRTGHAQRARHHRMRAERSLEIRQHVIAAVGRIELRDDDVAFHRRVREPMIICRMLDAGMGCAKAPAVSP